MRRRERPEAHGYSGLVDRRKGKPSDRRVPLARVEEVLRLYREVYFDLSIRHFHEKLSEERGIELSYTWVQKALQGAIFRRVYFAGGTSSFAPNRSNRCLVRP